MKPPKFKPGDAVEVRTGGGPRMVVLRVTRSGLVCLWMAGNKKHTDTFPAIAMMEATGTVLGIKEEIVRRAAALVKRQSKP